MNKLESNKRIFDALKQKPVVPNNTYPLNQTNIKQYINASDELLRGILTKIFKNTKHISYKTFKFILNNNFKEFLHYCKKNQIKSITIYLDTIDFKNITAKSNFWVAQHFYQYIKNKDIDFKINIFYDYNDIEYLDDNELILILDDCAYSGSQLSSLLRTKFDNKFKSFHIYLIIAFISEIAIDSIKASASNNKLILSKNNIIIRPISSYLDYMEKLLFKNYMDTYSIYFDHKLADEVSTITSIYSGIVIKNVNDLQQYIYDPNPIIIPVISNCEHIVTMNDIKLFFHIFTLPIWPLLISEVNI